MSVEDLCDDPSQRTSEDVQQAKHGGPLTGASLTQLQNRANSTDIEPNVLQQRNVLCEYDVHLDDHPVVLNKHDSPASTFMKYTEAIPRANI